MTWFFTMTVLIAAVFPHTLRAQIDNPDARQAPPVSTLDSLIPVPVSQFNDTREFPLTQVLEVQILPWRSSSQIQATERTAPELAFEALSQRLTALLQHPDFNLTRSERDGLKLRPGQRIRLALSLDGELYSTTFLGATTDALVDEEVGSKLARLNHVTGGRIQALLVRWLATQSKQLSDHRRKIEAVETARFATGSSFGRNSSRARTRVNDLLQDERSSKLSEFLMQSLLGSLMKNGMPPETKLTPKVVELFPRLYLDSEVQRGSNEDQSEGANAPKQVFMAAQSLEWVLRSVTSTSDAELQLPFLAMMYSKVMGRSWPESAPLQFAGANSAEPIRGSEPRPGANRPPGDQSDSASCSGGGFI